MKIMYIYFCMSTLLMFCFGIVPKQRIRVLPLHPYSASPTDYDPSTIKGRTFIDKYFFVEGVISADENLCDTINMFVRQYLRNNPSDFETYGSYKMYFFRKTDRLNSTYKNRGTDDTPKSHIDEDLLLKYEWSHNEFGGCSIYKKGEVIKTVFKSNDVLFKK